MPVISRPPKALGNADYADEVAQGKPDIIDVELDNDIKPLYALQNHAIDTSNLSDNAEIKYTQLHRPIGIQASDITGTLPATIITPGSITNTQIQTGQTTFGTGNVASSAGVSIGTTEQLISEVIWTPRRGGYFLAIARLSGQVTGNANENVTITMNLKLDGTAGAINGSLIDQSIQQVSFTVSPVFSWSIPWSVTLFSIRALSATGRVSITGQTTTPVASGFGLTVHTRTLTGWELA